MKKYKILVSVLAYDNGKSGIADYINHVIYYLSQEYQLDILIYEKDSYIFPIENENINLLKVSNKLSHPLISMFYHLFILPFNFPFSEYDFVFLPAGNRRLFSHYPIKTVVTFHDLSQFHIANKYDSKRMFYIKKIVPYFLKKVAIIMAISKSTKEDMIEFYGFSENSIALNYNGFDREKLVVNLDENEFNQRYNINSKYLLYISRIEHPGKNHINLIKAYEQLSPEVRAEYKLVFAGSDWNGAEIVHDYVENSFAKEDIIFLGFIPNSDVGAIYHYASLYVFPSLYEGFGIPLLEAMYSGIPVITSNCPPLLEIGGDATLNFDPLIPENICKVITEILENENLRNKLIERGYDRAKGFSWEKHCANIIKLVETKK